MKSRDEATAINSLGEAIIVGMAVDRVDHYKKGGSVVTINHAGHPERPVLVHWPRQKHSNSDEWCSAELLRPAEQAEATEADEATSNSATSSAEEAHAWLASYHGSYDATSLIVAHEAGQRTGSLATLARVKAAVLEARKAGYLGPLDAIRAIEESYVAEPVSAEDEKGETYLITSKRFQEHGLRSPIRLGDLEVTGRQMLWGREADQPAEISTEEARRSVPIGTVVRSGAGTIAARFDESHGVVLGDDRPVSWESLQLPLIVLYAPETDSTSTEERDRG